MTRRDEFAAERRARLRALQTRAPEPFDWRGLARLLRDVVLWIVVGGLAVLAFAWVLGAGFDWLERVLGQ